MSDAVNHPDHYGGADDPYEVIKVLEAWLTPEEFRGFLKGNYIKYQARAGKKGSTHEDLQKAAWYQKRHIELLAPRSESVLIVVDPECLIDVGVMTANTAEEIRSTMGIAPEPEVNLCPACLLGGDAVARSRCNTHANLERMEAQRELDRRAADEDIPF